MRRPEGYVYRPWTQERRDAFAAQSLLRRYGSMENVAAERTRKLQDLIAERDDLTLKLKKVRSNISYLVGQMEKDAAK